jgi:phosphoenolpyruvate carboxykinase (ATP)
VEPKIDQLEKLGFENLGRVYWDLPTSSLYEEAIRRREGVLAHLGPLVVRTGQYTGRSPHDKFLVEEPETRQQIWWGDINQPISPEKYERLRNRVLAYLQGRDLYVQEVYAGAAAEQRINVQMVTESAWHALFARNMFILEVFREKLKQFEPDYTVIHAPNFKADPELDGTNSEAFIILHFGRKEVLIGGTAYAGEVKKSVFTVMNYLLPQKDVLSMHCSANYGSDPTDGALFFGLSGTGKTSLSVVSNRTLIGDDEHGWSEKGVFNIEGGSYAKVIRISKEQEPEIYQTTRMFGTVLENVAIDEDTRHLDLDSNILTENTRAAFPISHLENATRAGTAGHPKVIFFLTADAFGVLPPISLLTPQQAVYYFLLGYTAKVAGTERGVNEPQATFSPCFGAPFMVHPPETYARLLGEKITQHRVKVWLVNTGWIEGPYGQGHRIDLPYTRSMVDAAMHRKLEESELIEEPVFGLRIPEQVPDVPSEILQPRNTWEDPEAYDQKARDLAAQFRKAFREFEDKVSPEVLKAGPSPNRAH